MGKKATVKEEMVRVIIDSSDASKDQYIPRWALQRFIVGGLIIKDTTNNGWCSKNGKRLPYGGK